MNKNLFRLILLTLSGVVMLLHGQGTASVHAHLVGTWRFVSATQQLQDGTTRPDPRTGPHGVGYLIYTESGHVCALVANPERKRWDSVQTPTEAELRNAFAGLVAYAGTFEVNETEGYVVHHVEVDRVPNSTGNERKRFCSFSGNRLILRAAPPLPAEVKEWTIVWERVGK